MARQIGSNRLTSTAGGCWLIEAVRGGVLAVAHWVEWRNAKPPQLVEMEFVNSVRRVRLSCVDRVVVWKIFMITLSADALCEIKVCNNKIKLQKKKKLDNQKIC